MEKTNFTIPAAIVLAGALVAGAILFTRSDDQGAAVAQALNDTPITIRPVDSTDHIVGNPNAEVVVIEYSDTECPFCKNFHQTMRQIMDEYGKEGSVAWVYRHFPLEQLHSKAVKEAEATECAAYVGGPNKFWDYINRLFEVTPSNDGLEMAQSKFNG